METEKVESLMAMCRRGADSRPESDRVLDDCYSALKSLVQERDRLLRNEYICHGCGIRKDAERPGHIPF